MLGWKEFLDRGPCILISGLTCWDTDYQGDRGEPGLKDRDSRWLCPSPAKQVVALSLKTGDPGSKDRVHRDLEPETGLLEGKGESRLPVAPFPQAGGQRERKHGSLDKPKTGANI